MYLARISWVICKYLCKTHCLPQRERKKKKWEKVVRHVGHHPHHCSNTSFLCHGPLLFSLHFLCQSWCVNITKKPVLLILTSASIVPVYTALWAKHCCLLDQTVFYQQALPAGRWRSTSKPCCIRQEGRLSAKVIFLIYFFLCMYFGFICHLI